MVNKKHKSKIPYLIIAFIVSYTLLDLVFVYISKLSYNGIVTQDAYYKGTKYNEVIQQNRKQQSLGWVDSLDYSYSHNSSELTLNFSLYDEKRTPISGAEVIADVRRPVTDKYDILISLDEVGSGQYSKAFYLPQIGQWEIKINAKVGAEDYFLNKRIIVK